MKGLWSGRYRLDGRAAMTRRQTAWLCFAGVAAWRADAGFLKNSMPPPEDDFIKIGELFEGRRVPKKWVAITRSKSAPQPVREKGWGEARKIANDVIPFCTFAIYRVPCPCL